MPCLHSSAVLRAAASNKTSSTGCSRTKGYDLGKDPEKFLWEAKKKKTFLRLPDEQLTVKKLQIVGLIKKQTWRLPLRWQATWAPKLCLDPSSHPCLAPAFLWLFFILILALSTHSLHHCHKQQDYISEKSVMKFARVRKAEKQYTLPLETFLHFPRKLEGVICADLECKYYT